MALPTSLYGLASSVNLRPAAFTMICLGTARSLISDR
jgi:hypothetical protein